MRISELIDMLSKVKDQDAIVRIGNSMLDPMEWVNLEPEDRLLEGGGITDNPEFDVPEFDVDDDEIRIEIHEDYKTWENKTKTCVRICKTDDLSLVPDVKNFSWKFDIDGNLLHLPSRWMP